MSTKILSVFDSKADAYLTPMFAPTTAYALRMFTEAANNPTHDFCKFPGDFTLFELGEWDEGSGEIMIYSAAVNLTMAINCKEPNNGDR